MITQKINLRFAVLVLFILLTAFLRLIPHIPNFSPLGAMSLFGAAYFTKKWQAVLIPIAATWISDLFFINVIYSQYYPSFTWFYEGFYWQYGSYLLIIFAAFFILKKVSTSRILLGALMSTILFFLITNFGCFPGNPNYPQTINGLMTCYVAGIPFLKGTLFGDLFYSGVLFGLFAILQQRFAILKLAR